MEEDIKALKAMQSKLDSSLDILLVEASKLIEGLPKWQRMEPVLSEVNRRFQNTDVDEYNLKVARCVEFQAEWENEKRACQRRLESLHAELCNQIDVAIEILSKACGIVSGIRDFESKEN